MKKGFTLIELLAVIVILAVIALIATPIILNIIDDARKNSAKESAKLYIDGLNTSITSKLLINDGTPSQCFITNGILLCDGKTVDYEVSGEKPTSGYISYNNGIVAEYALCIMDYKISKVGNNTIVEKTNECTNGGQVLPTEEIDLYAGSGKSSSLTGCGTEDNPYLITSANDLIYMRDQINSGEEITTTSTCEYDDYNNYIHLNNAYYKQTANISLNDTTNWKNWNENTTGLYEWEPIQGDESYFSGIYDGDNHSISGIYISNMGETDEYDNYLVAGLFGYTEYIQVKNLRVVKSYMSSSIAGGIIASVLGEFIMDNCYTDVKIEGAYIGGMIGETRAFLNSELTNLYSNSTLISINNAGGIVGYYHDMYDFDGDSVILRNLTNSGNIVCDVPEDIYEREYINEVNACGGIIGDYFSPWDHTFSADRLYNLGNISYSLNHNYFDPYENDYSGIISSAGGLFGSVISVDINLSNSTNSGNLTCAASYDNYVTCEGIIGSRYDSSVNLTNTSNLGNISVTNPEGTGSSSNSGSGGKR